MTWRGPPLRLAVLALGLAIGGSSLLFGIFACSMTTPVASSPAVSRHPDRVGRVGQLMEQRNFGAADVHVGSGATPPKGVGCLGQIASRDRSFVGGEPSAHDYHTSRIF